MTGGLRRLRDLPRVDDLLEAAPELRSRYGHAAVVGALRRALDAARDTLRNGGAADASAVLAAAGADLRARRPGPPRLVLNATGVILHTNLGRAPLSEAARHAIADAAGYCDLEYDLNTGVRGTRGARVEPLLAEACGAQAALAVNNAAAALVLALATLASGRDVLVSRGELVEIGGSFRLPDIMAASGARLVEVGTTNRTRAADYRTGPDTALLLRVHPSNYRITGFTSAPAVSELAAVAAQAGVPLVYDTGSGLLTDRTEPWLAGEPSVSGALRDGANLVVCSGDKLLGGPQAGLLVGRADLVGACARHPLARALRLDKLRVAALAATLEAHVKGDLLHVPVPAMLAVDDGRLARRAERLAGAVGGQVTRGESLVGGGAAPDAVIPSPVVRLPCQAPSDVARRLRTGDPPVIVRVDSGAVWLDPRTLPAEDDGLVGRLVRQVLEAPPR